MTSEKLNGTMSVQSIDSQIFKASPAEAERLFVVNSFLNKTTEVNDM